MNGYHLEALAALYDVLPPMPEGEKTERMIGVALAHHPEGFREAPPRCRECDRLWPCATFVMVTGIGDR